jgi:hypothetical protein
MKTHVALALAFLVSGCGGSQSGSGDFEGVAVEGKADGVRRMAKRSVAVAASVDFGGSASLDYSGHPRFSALSIAANAGDHLSATITSADGVPVAYLLTDGTPDYYNLVATAKDAADAQVAMQKLEVTIPATATYYLVVRDQDVYTATFNVSIATRSGVPAVVTACADDTDCVAVYQGGCCPHGVRFAVNRDHVADYLAGTACDQPQQICPRYIIQDLHVPKCDATAGQCVMVEPSSCDATNACPTGQNCGDRGFCTVDVVTN